MLEIDIDADSYLPLKIEATNQTALGSVGNGEWKCDKVSNPQFCFPLVQ